jgi:hypothetical protein
LQAVVAVRQLRSSGSILSNNKLRRSPQNGFAVTLFILANKARFSAPTDKTILKPVQQIFVECQLWSKTRLKILEQTCYTGGQF